MQNTCVGSEEVVKGRELGGGEGAVFGRFASHEKRKREGRNRAWQRHGI